MFKMKDKVVKTHSKGLDIKVKAFFITSLCLLVSTLAIVLPLTFLRLF